MQTSYNGPQFGKKKRLYFAGTNFNVNLLPQTVFLLGGIGCRLECFVNIIIIHFYCSVLQALLGSSKESSPSYSTNTGGYISPVTSYNPLSTSSYNTPSSSYRAPSLSTSYLDEPEASSYLPLSVSYKAPSPYFTAPPIPHHLSSNPTARKPYQNTLLASTYDKVCYLLS